MRRVHGEQERSRHRPPSSGVRRSAGPARPGGRDPPGTAEGAPRLTTQQGTVVSDDQNSLRVGDARPVRAGGLPFPGEDLPLRPRAHPRAGGARPRLRRRMASSRTYESLADITRADPFSSGRRAHAGLRAVLHRGGQQGLARPGARRARLRRRSSTPSEGNWDLVGNNIPVFFIQDAIKFPDLIHAAKQEPDRGFPQAQTAHDNFWDFISLTARSQHAHGHVDHVGPGHPALVPLHGGLRRPHLPAGQRRGQVDLREVPLEAEAAACSRWCGTRRSRSTAPTPTSTAATCGTPSTAATFPSGSSACSSSTRSSPTSSTSTCSMPTKIIPEEEVPIRASGRLVLDRVVDNFFAETEQVAFCTQNVVPGIDFTNDPLLQGRNFSYLDTQLKRLGSPNFTHLPINAPKCPFAQLPAGRAHGDDEPARGASTTSRTRWARDGARARTRPRASAPTRGRGSRPTQAARCGRRASPTTTARRGSSSSARPRSSRTTSPTRSCSS